jgi:hypothetical protein
MGPAAKGNRPLVVLKRSGAVSVDQVTAITGVCSQTLHQQVLRHCTSRI